MSRPHGQSGRGPFRADQVRSGDPYELSQGHPIVCAPTGHEGSEANRLGATVRIVGADDALTAPGVLALPVPVRALFDRDAAHETTLRNLLAAKGYPSLDAVRREGVDAGVIASRRTVLRMLLEAAGVTVTPDDEAREAACDDLATLDAWILRAPVARSRGDVFDAP